MDASWPEQQRILTPGKNEKVCIADALDVRTGTLDTTGAARKGVALFCELLSKPQRLDIPDVLQAPLRAWWTTQDRPTSGPVFPMTRGPRKGEARIERGVSFADRRRRALMLGPPAARVHAARRAPDSASALLPRFRVRAGLQ